MKNKINVGNIFLFTSVTTVTNTYTRGYQNVTNKPNSSPSYNMRQYCPLSVVCKFNRSRKRDGYSEVDKWKIGKIGKKNVRKRGLCL